LKFYLSKFYLNVSTCTKCLIIQNVNEILIFKKIQVNGALKDIYVLSNYVIYNHNISKK